MSLFYSNGKNYCFTEGAFLISASILGSGLIAGGRESKGGRRTIFFTPLNPVRGQSRPKKNRAMTHQNREEHTITFSGSQSPGRRLLDQFSPSTRKGIAVLADKISCRNCVQLCAGRLHLQCELS